MKSIKSKLDVYQDSRGRWRWRFSLMKAGAWDVQAVGTETFDHAGDAEFNAKFIIYQPWEDTELEHVLSLKWWEKLINYFTR